MTLPDPTTSILHGLVHLFSGPQSRAAVDAIEDVEAMGVRVIASPSDAQAAIRRILESAATDEAAIGLIDELPRSEIQSVFVLCLASVKAASAGSQLEQVH